MPDHTNYRQYPGPHWFVPGVGRVPTGPRSFKGRTSTPGEEDEIYNLSSSSSFSSRYSSASVRGNQYSSNSSGSPCGSDKIQPNDEALMSSKRSALGCRDARGSHEWPQTVVTQENGQYVLGGRRDNTHDSAHSRSRSRSPVRVRHPNGNIFSRTGSLLAGPNDQLFPRRVSSFLEASLLIKPPNAPPSGCTCCVSEFCQFRGEDSKDCRPLVPTLRPWMKLELQESQNV
jgi:hypothetical protein